MSFCASKNNIAATKNKREKEKIKRKGGGQNELLRAMDTQQKVNKK